MYCYNVHHDCWILYTCYTWGNVSLILYYLRSTCSITKVYNIPIDMEWKLYIHVPIFCSFQCYILYIKHLSHLWLLLIKLNRIYVNNFDFFFMYFKLSLLHSFKNRWLNWFNYLALPYQSGHNVSTCCLNNACACMHGAYAFRIT